MRYLILLFLLVVALPSFAGYTQLKPPAAWIPPASVGATAGFRGGATAANDATIKGSTVLTNATLNVAGQAITVPVGLRIAANAGSLAATFAFGNPYLFAGIAAGSALYQWYTNKGYSTDGSAWFAESPRTCTATYCTEFRGTYGSTAGAWSGSSLAAGQSLVDALNSAPGSMEYRLRIENGYRFLDARERNGLYPWIDKYDQYAQGTRDVAVTPASKVPVDKSKFISDLSPLPVPDALPALAPGVVFPVDMPVVNPDPAVSPAPAPSPVQQPTPLWIPTGDPVKNPNPAPASNPDTWTQPGVRVNPSPTPSDPWRVDVVLEPKTKTDPSTNSPTPPVSTAAKPEPIDIQTCGLPGKPKCQIDEAGTPTYDPKKFELDRPTLDTASKTQRDTVSSATDKATLFTPWATFFTLPPLAACTPIAMPVYAGAQIASLNVCPAAEWLRGLMGFVWAAVGFFFVFRTVQDAI